MEFIYPEGPSDVGQHIKKTTFAYRLQAWLAMVGLLFFVVVYLGMTAWFGWTAYRVLEVAVNGRGDTLIHWVVGLSSGFLALFMLKALFFVKHGGEINDLEVKEENEPVLFAFLNRIADEAGAPRPHRVFLSTRVNAAVFYDLSLLNFLFPSRKNLEIGLALVNVLSLSELKAVLAHEFGHFGQRSMAVGRWVYVAQQIAAHIIERRDALDGFLRFLSNIDLRIAWIGWILRLIVWSLRAVLESVFSLVVIAQRALSREMEFQADLVAVSLTGSDALVNALHRLQAADEAWDRSLGFVSDELGRGEATKDIFAVQLRILERMRDILHDPDYGLAPAVPAEAPETHRVFQADIALPPRMWATHPMNHEREENAKRVYLAAPLDNRSAWEVFADPQALRERATEHLINNTEVKTKRLDDSLKALDGQFSQPFLHGVYRGAYLGRSVVRFAQHPKQLYDSTDKDQAIANLTRLYPESLTHDLEEVRNLEREVALLEALRDGTYRAPGGVIRHRDATLKRRELPSVIEQVRGELRALQEDVNAHDRMCRTAHVAAAGALGGGWKAYLEGVTALLHYADHSEANLRDAQGFLGNVVAVITADRHVSNKELKRLLQACGDVYSAIEAVFADAKAVRLNERLTQTMGVSSWAEALGEFNFPPASRDNINDWMNAVDGWINHAAGACAALRSAALDELLSTETQIARWYREGKTADAAPNPPTTPEQYVTLPPGKERKRQKRLGIWDRFQTADGFFPGLTRFVVSTGIVGAAMVTGGVLWLT